MTFAWQSEIVGQDEYYISITQDAYSNLLSVQAWRCDGYGICQHKINESTYHKDDMKKAKATFRRYVRKCKELAK